MDSSTLLKLVVAEPETSALLKFLVARMAPPDLRTLDAIHIATARSLDGLAGIVTYDARISRAGSGARFKVWSPA